MEMYFNENARKRKSGPKIKTRKRDIWEQNRFLFQFCFVLFLFFQSILKGIPAYSKQELLCWDTCIFTVQALGCSFCMALLVSLIISSSEFLDSHLHIKTDYYKLVDVYLKTKPSVVSGTTQFPYIRSYFKNYFGDTIKVSCSSLVEILSVCSI